MPILSQQTRDLKILQAMGATRLMASGVNKTIACEQVGISIRQYDYWLARDNGAIEGLQKVMIEAGRVQLADITNAYAIILRHLLREMMQPGIDPLLALKVLKYLDGLKEVLKRNMGSTLRRMQLKLIYLRDQHSGLRNQKWHP